MFDAVAAEYDATFTDTLLGGYYRRAVWDRLAERLPELPSPSPSPSPSVLEGPTGAIAGPSRILELNCGTGADAVWLAGRGHRVHATDVSPAMVDQTRAAARRAGMDERITTEVLALEDLGRLAAAGHRYDAILSDFGGLNCVLDPDPVLAGMAAILEPGGWAMLCVMGPTVPWEWLWFLAHGQPRRAARRLARHPSWRGQPLRYPSAAAMRRRARRHGLAPARTTALGALLPPPYSEPWAIGRPQLIAGLDRLERRWETNPLLVRAADHYLLELVRAR